MIILHRIALAATLAALMVAFVVAVGGAQARPTPSALSIASVAVEDGVAILSGTVEDVQGQLAVNGQSIDVSDAGDFLATVDLDAAAVVFSLVETTGETVSIRIPIDVVVDDRADVLSHLVAAGVSLDVPIDGFTIVDGQWSPISGNVLNELTLASLTINGVEVLNRIGPFGDFALQLPWTQHPPRHATVVVTDRRGVSQTTTYRVNRIRSVVRTRAGTSVSAAGARGLVVAGLRFDAQRLSAGRLGVLVTVKDRRGYLVRGAALRLAAAPARYLATGPTQAGFSNRLGQARFTYRLRSAALSTGMPRALTVQARAATATATASRKAAVRLPIAY
jgi:hypothetical protein